MPEGKGLKKEDKGNAFRIRKRGSRQMNQEEVLKIARHYADSVREIIPVRSVYLYGSWARGSAGRDSDIDILVIVDELPEDYLGTLTLLWKLTRGE